MGGKKSTRDRDSQTNVPPSIRNETVTQNEARKTKVANQYGAKADAYARDKLGIKNTMGGFMDRNVTGFKSTANPYGDVTQSYGEDYNQLRGEYLATEGLAKKREVTDARGQKSYTYDPRNADGKYTDLSRGAAQNAKDRGTPLSEEMFEGQQTAKKMLLGLGGIMSGMPLAFTSLYYASKRPYSEYVGEYYNKGRNASTQTNRNNITQTNRNNKDVKTVSSGSGGGGYSETTAKNRYDPRRARTGETKASQQGRALYASSNKLIKGTM